MMIWFYTVNYLLSTVYNYNYFLFLTIWCQHVVKFVHKICLSFYPQFIAEFDLRSVQYEVKSPRCHEMRLAAPPHDSISFNFRCDREAEEWATVVMSSLREAHRGQLRDIIF